MSYTGVAGGATLSGFTGLASAGSSDGPSVGTEVVVRSPPGGTDKEWNAYINEFILQVSPEIPSYDNPGGLAIEGCYPDGDIEVCLSTPAALYYGPKDCGGIQTPEVYWTDVTATVTKNDIFQVEVSFWIGVNPTDGCLLVGNEDAGVCKSLGCNLPDKRDDLNNGDPSPFTIPFVSGKDWLTDNADIVTDIGNSPTLRANSGAVTAGVMAAAALASLNEINDPV